MKYKPFNCKAIALAVASTPFVTLDVASAEEKLVIEEIVVTARKREESLMDTALSVTAVTGASMDEQGITDLLKLSTQLPGVVIGEGVQTTNIYIRGIGSGANVAFEQSVGLYIDEIYQARSRQFNMAMVDVRQVEVLRGPQSVLFGKNTTAGAITVSTESPQIGDDFNGYVAADYEPTQDTVRGTAVFSGDLNDTLAARVAMRVQDADGYIDNQIRNSDERAGKEKLGRLTLVWQPSETLDITGKVSYVEYEGTGSTITTPVADPSLLASFGQPGNNLPITSVMGTVAAFAVPGYQAATGSKKYDSWISNENWFPGGTDTDDIRFLQTSFHINWDIGNYTVSSISGYTDWKNERLIDADFHGGNVTATYDTDDLQQVSQELRVASDYDGRLNFMAGLYYEQREGVIRDQSAATDGTLGGVFGTLPANALSPGLPPGLTMRDLGFNSLWNGAILAGINPALRPLIGTELESVAWELDDQVDDETLGVFFSVSFDITDTLNIDFGARYSEDTKEARQTRLIGVGKPGQTRMLVNGDGSLTVAGQDSPLEAALANVVVGSLFGRPVQQTKKNRTENHFDPGVNLRWNLSDESMAYLSYTSGYKSGGFSVLESFEDEKANAWELGLKASVWDSRARIAASIFYTEMEDLQVTAWDGVSFIVTNAAKMVSQGVEFDGQILVSKNLEIGGTLSYLDAEYDSYTDAPCTIYQQAASSAGCIQDLSGERTPFAPEWSGHFYSRYEVSLNDNLMLRLRADAIYKDEYFTSADNDPNGLQDAFWKFNARAGIGSSKGAWEVAIYGTNLTNERTIASTLSAPASAGIYASGVEQARVYGLQARYNF